MDNCNHTYLFFALQSLNNSLGFATSFNFIGLGHSKILENLDFRHYIVKACEWNVNILCVIIQKLTEFNKANKKMKFWVTSPWCVIHIKCSRINHLRPFYLYDRLAAYKIKTNNGYQALNHQNYFKVNKFIDKLFVTSVIPYIYTHTRTWTFCIFKYYYTSKYTEACKKYLVTLIFYYRNIKPLFFKALFQSQFLFEDIFTNKGRIKCSFTLTSA